MVSLFLKQLKIKIHYLNKQKVKVINFIYQGIDLILFLRIGKRMNFLKAEMGLMKSNMQ